MANSTFKKVSKMDFFETFMKAPKKDGNFQNQMISISLFFYNISSFLVHFTTTTHLMINHEVIS